MPKGARIVAHILKLKFKVDAERIYSTVFFFKLHTEKSISESCQIKTNLDWTYTFMIDLAPNEIRSWSREWHADPAPSTLPFKTQKVAQCSKRCLKKSLKKLKKKLLNLYLLTVFQGIFFPQNILKRVQKKNFNIGAGRKIRRHLFHYNVKNIKKREPNSEQLNLLSFLSFNPKTSGVWL